MSYDFVGLENLPNVYFKKISLSNNDLDTFKVTTSLVLIDEIFEGFFVWSEDNIIFDFLKISLILTSNDQLINSLSNGTIDPMPSMLKKDRVLMSGTNIQEIPIKNFLLSKDSNTKRFSINTSFLAPVGAQNLSLFAFAYIDSKELSNSLKISLTGPLSRYYGSTISENVIVNGEIERRSFIYKKTGGEIWSGPVHQNVAGDWMAGSFHTSEQHARLVREEVLNTKIVDKRKESIPSRSPIDFSGGPLFSELLTSFNNEADLIGLFSIDFRTLLLTKTEYGKKMFNVSKGFFEEFAKNIRINSIEIRRQQVKFDASTNKLGTRKYSQTLVGQYKTIEATVENVQGLVNTDKLSQLYISTDPLIKTFQFIDTEMSEKSRGEFRYEVVMSFIDSTKSYLQGLIFQMQKNTSQLKVEIEMLFRPSRYDRVNDRLREGVQVPDIFNQSIENYYNNLAIFVEIDEDKKRELIENQKKSFNRENYTNREAENFLLEYSLLVTKMKRKFDLQEVTSNFSGGVRPSKSVSKGLTLVRHDFENIVNFSSVGSSYDYLGIKSNKSMPSFTIEEYMKRAEMESNRFFDNTRSKNSNDLYDLDTESAEAIKDLSFSKVLFFSPLSFKFKEQVKDLTSLQDLDSDGVATNFITHISEKSSDPRFSSSTIRKEKKVQPKKPSKKPRRSIRKKRFGRTKFNFKRTPFKINNLKTEDYLEVSKYLGPNSEMVNIETNLKEVSNSPNTEQVETKVAITNGLSVKREKKSFDLQTKNNIFEKFKSSPKFKVDKLRRIPTSIKALFNSRSSAAKNNILESESDILKDAETKVSTEMIFHASQKVEYFSGFESDVNGVPNVLRPKWEEITPTALKNNKRLLCRMKYAEIPELDIRPAPEFKLLAQNSTFIISDEEISSKITMTEEVVEQDLESQIELPEVDKIVFASSNPIVQNPNRKNQLAKLESKEEEGGRTSGQINRYR